MRFFRKPLRSSIKYENTNTLCKWILKSILSTPKALFLVVELIALYIYPFKLVEKWQSLFIGKKILVLGTGPSLELISNPLIQQYDVIIFLNKAIEICPHFNFRGVKKVFFNTDTDGLIDLIPMLSQLDNSWSFIVIPLFIGRFLRVLPFLLMRRAHVIVPNYTIKYLNDSFGYKRSSRATQTVVGYRYITKKALTSGIFTLPYRVIPYTVALNAFYISLHSKPSCVHYLGCDFSSQRAKGITQPSFTFKSHSILLWLNQLNRLADTLDVELRPAR